MQVPNSAWGRPWGRVLHSAIVVQQMHMGKPSDARGENFPHFPMRLHCLLDGAAADDDEESVRGRS